jgi:hypothetical protein
MNARLTVSPLAPETFLILKRSCGPDMLPESNFKFKIHPEVLLLIPDVKTLKKPRSMKLRDDQIEYFNKNERYNDVFQCTAFTLMNYFAKDSKIIFNDL